MQNETKNLLKYLAKMNYCDCIAFMGDMGRRAQQIVGDLNNGEIKSALDISATRRFRSFKDESLVFVVRTR